MLSFSRTPQAPVTRTIQVPNDKGLFIPIMSVVVSQCETSDQLQAVANKDQSSIEPPSLSLELDGDKLQDLPAYISNPAAIGTFSVKFPAPEIRLFSILIIQDLVMLLLVVGMSGQKNFLQDNIKYSFKGKLRCTSTKLYRHRVYGRFNI